MCVAIIKIILCTYFLFYSPGISGSDLSPMYFYSRENLSRIFLNSVKQQKRENCNKNTLLFNSIMLAATHQPFWWVALVASRIKQFAIHILVPMFRHPQVWVCSSPSCKRNSLCYGESRKLLCKYHCRCNYVYLLVVKHWTCLLYVDHFCW